MNINPIILNTNKSYSTVQLGTRTFDSFPSEAEFITMIRQDLAEAIAAYEEFIKPYIEAWRKDRKEQALASTINSATKYAENKWKTEKRRNQYITDELAKVEEKYSTMKPIGGDITFFDFDPNCGTSMGIPSDCIITAKSTDESLKRAYKYLAESKFIQYSRGWSFEYETSTSIMTSSFRPSIKPIVSDEIAAEINKGVESLTNSVNSFYANTKYWGD